MPDLEEERKKKLSKELLFYLLAIENLLNAKSLSVRRYWYRLAAAKLIQLETITKSDIRLQIAEKLAQGFGSEEYPKAVFNRLAYEADKAVKQGFGSSRLFTTDILRAKEPTEEIQRIYQQAQAPIDISSNARNILRKYLLDRSVTIRGRKYNLEYYNSLVAFQKSQEALSKGVIERAKYISQLVQVSGEPSLRGDYCDAYAGKVFSTEDNHPVFEFVGDLPNGGCPFHPWCQHTLEVYYPAGDDWETLQGLAEVDPEMMGKSHKELVATWYETDKEKLIAND